jgi:hypothetical protein
MFAPKNELPGDAFENTAFQQWSSLLTALHLFVKQIPPTDSCHQLDSDRCHSRPLMPELTLVSLLQRYLVLETVMPRGGIRKRPSAHL